MYGAPPLYTYMYRQAVKIFDKNVSLRLLCVQSNLKGNSFIALRVVDFTCNNV